MLLQIQAQSGTIKEVSWKLFFFFFILIQYFKVMLFHIFSTSLLKSLSDTIVKYYSVNLLYSYTFPF